MFTMEDYRGVLLRSAIIYTIPLIAGSAILIIREVGILYWLVIGVLISIYHVGYFYIQFSSEEEDSLTLGCLVTLSRGSLTVLIGAFIFVSIPWAVAMLYCFLLISDYFDGYIARLENNDTDLRRRVDNEFDAMALLIVITVGVSYGRFPLWFLSVALIKYVYSLGLYLRFIMGKMVRDLPDRRSRRMIGGTVTVFTLVGMVPILESQLILAGAVPVAVIVFVSFARDWYLVTRQRKEDSRIV